MNKQIAGWIAGAAIFASVSAAKATDLNALVNDHPTTGSEIVRGHNAAEDCNSGDAVVDPNLFWKCVSDADSANRQAHANSEAFSVGLYFWAWIREDSGWQSMAKMTDNSLAVALAPREEQVTKTLFALYRDHQKELGVTDQQVFSALHLAAADDITTRIAFWDHSGG